MSEAIGLLADITLDQGNNCGVYTPPNLSLSVTEKTTVDHAAQKPARGIMNFSKTDLLRLLGLLEAELQARELVIASLKAERIKLLQAPSGQQQRYTVANPYRALGRDLEDGNTNNSSSNEDGDATNDDRANAESALAYLEDMVAKHKKAEAEMRTRVDILKESHEKMVSELQEEKRKHAHDTAQGDDVTYMLEKERERLAQQLDFEKSQQKRLERETKRTQAALVLERKKHLQFAKVILDERKALLMELGEMKQRMDELEDMMIVKEAQLASSKASLHKERKRFTKVEAGIEKRLSEFDIEREQLRAKLHREENRTQELREELNTANNCINDLQLANAEVRRVDNGNNENPTSATNGRNGRDKPLGRVTGSPIPVAKVGKIGTPRGVRTTPPRSDKSESSSSGSEELCSPMSPTTSVVKPVAGKAKKANYQPQYGTAGMPSPDTRIVENDNAKSEVKPSLKQKGSLMYSKGNSKNLSPATSLDRLNSRANTSSPPPQKSSKIPSSTGNASRVSLMSPQQNRKGSIEMEKAGSKLPSSPFPKPAATNLVRPTALTSSPFMKAVESFKAGPKKVASLSQSGVGHQSPIAFQSASKSGSSSLPKAAVSPLLNTVKKPAQQPSKSPTPTQLTPAPVSRSNPLTPTGPTTKPLTQPPVFTPPVKRTISPRDSTPVIAQLPPTTAPSCSHLHQVAVVGDTATLCRLIEEHHSPNSTDTDGSTPVHAAAEHGQLDCLELLLNLGGDGNMTKMDGSTPIHGAAGQGHESCLCLLLERNCNPSAPDSLGWYPIHRAAANRHADCIRTLIDHGATRHCITKDGWTPLHCATRSNHVDCLQALLYHRADTSPDEDPTSATTSRLDERLVPSELINTPDQEGWTVAHIAASAGEQDCLEMLFQYGDLDLNARDKWLRTPIDVASEPCKEYLLSLEGKLITVLMEHTGGSTNQKEERQQHVAGQLTVQPGMTWTTFDLCVATVLSNHSKDLEGCAHSRRKHDNEKERSSDESDGTDFGLDLGLGAESVKSYTAGNLQWLPGDGPKTMQPHPAFTLTSQVTVQLRSTGDTSLDQLAYETLIPLATLHNYARLIEQYKSVVFYGSSGTGKTRLASQLAEFIKIKLQHQGHISSTIHYLALHSRMTLEEFTKTLHSKGIFMSTNDISTSMAKPVPILVLDNLEKIALPGVLTDLLKGLEHRGSRQAVPLSPPQANGTFHLHPECIVIGTMDKTSSGLDLATQHCFRWIQFHHDREPVVSMLPRYLLRRLITHAGGKPPTAEDPSYQAMQWICHVWQRLNDCFMRLDLKHATLGPKLFRACPVDSEGPNSVFRWFCLLWNHAIAPGIEDSLHRKNAASHSYQRLATTTLYVLLQRAVFPGCPFTGEDFEDYMSSFRGVNELLVQLSAQKTGSLKRSRRSKSLDRSRTSNKAALLASKQQSALDLDASHSDRSTRSLIPRRVPKPHTKQPTRDSNSNPLNSPSRPDLIPSSPTEDTDLLESLLQLQGCQSDSEMDQLTRLQENLISGGGGGGGHMTPAAIAKRKNIAQSGVQGGEKLLRRVGLEGEMASAGHREKTRRRSEDGVWDVWEETV